MNSRAGFAIKI